MLTDDSDIILDNVQGYRTMTKKTLPGFNPFSVRQALKRYIQEIGRKKLLRRETEVQTQFGAVKAKAVMRDGEKTVVPEFEECRRIAEERGISILEVHRILSREFVQLPH